MISHRLHFIDYIILFLFIAAIVFACIRLFAPHSSLVVKADNIEYRFPLNEDGIYKVKGSIGITEIEIKDGRIRFLSSPCPNKTCISKGFSSTIVCLPNRVIATIDSSEDSLDAIAR